MTGVQNVTAATQSDLRQSTADNSALDSDVSSTDATVSADAQAQRPQTTLTTSSAAMDGAITAAELAATQEGRADLATGRADSDLLGTAGTVGTALSAGTAGTAGSLAAGDNLLEPLVTSMQGRQGSLAAENDPMAGLITSNQEGTTRLAAEDSVFEPLVTAQDASEMERAAEASLQSEQDLLAINGSALQPLVEAGGATSSLATQVNSASFLLACNSLCVRDYVGYQWQCLAAL